MGVSSWAANGCSFRECFIRRHLKTSAAHGSPSEADIPVGVWSCCLSVHVHLKHAWPRAPCLRTETSLRACPPAPGQLWAAPRCPPPALRGRGSWHSRGSGVLPQRQELRALTCPGGQHLCKYVCADERFVQKPVWSAALAPGSLRVVWSAAEKRRSPLQREEVCCLSGVCRAPAVCLGTVRGELYAWCVSRAVTCCRFCRPIFNLLSSRVLFH